MAIPTGALVSRSSETPGPVLLHDTAWHLDRTGGARLAAPSAPAKLARKGKFALLASCIFHAAVAAFLVVNIGEQVLIEGSEHAGVTILGNAPVDETAAGDPQMADPSMTVTLITMLDAKPVESVDAAALPTETVEGVEAPASDVLEPVREMAAVQPPTPPAPEAAPERIEPTPVPTANAVQPEVLTARTVTPDNDNNVPLPAAEPATEAPQEPVEPEQPHEVAPAETTDTVGPQPETRELQPEPEPMKVEPKKSEPRKVEPKKAEQRKAEPKKAKRQAEETSKPKEQSKPASSGAGGKGKQNARRGAEDGEADGKIANKGKGGKGAAGNAAVSNYPGKVVSKLRRSLRGIPRSAIRQARNDVQVGFTVNADGSVSGVRIARSSGSAALDEAALAVVRRAAPFPPIPADAGRFTWAFAVPLGIAR